MRERILHHLERLVGFDTRNPPRRVVPDEGLFEYLRFALGPSFQQDIMDHGDGCVSFFAMRGRPRFLFNFHVDTVPAASGYSRDPLTLVVDGERAYGLGACDIKGAAACMLAALEADQDADVALLFTSDEEAGDSRCVRTFCERHRRFELAVVAEPTQGLAVLDHRGIATATAHFRGIAGHASSGRADQDSALHHAIAWSARALAMASRAQGRSFGELRGICFNIGRIEGGTKPNIIADHTEVKFGFRPLPGDAPLDLLADFEALARGLNATFSPGFVAASLPASAGHRQAARAFVGEFGVDIGKPVDFWTEAALFAQAGTPAVVLGPGDIAQAHTADEWVAIVQLERVAAIYADILAQEAGTRPRPAL